VPTTTPPAEYSDLAALMRGLATEALDIAPDIRLLFVTNLRVGEAIDIGPDGISNIAQYYTQREADEIIRSLQGLGVTVEPFFSEQALVKELLRDNQLADTRTRVVYSTAEGGSGSGRRALVPALCNLLGVPALNSGAHASSLVRHKFHAYAILRHAGVRVPESWQFAADGWKCGKGPVDGARVIVKPTYESMGIGVDDESVRVVDADFLEFVTSRYQRFGQPAVVQEFVSGEEVGVPVARIGSTYALPPIVQRRANGESYAGLPKTFYDEHVRHDLSHVVFDAPEAEVTALRRAAVLAFDALDMKGVGRIDFRIDADGRAWAFDTNGEPPPLPRTCWSAAMERLGLSFHELLAVWLGTCLLDYGLISGIGPKR
jgi:D-alanine-D-alanine ligase